MRRSATVLPLLAALAAAAPAAPAAAQPRTIAAGMSEAEVVRAFGHPARVRDAGEWRYLFYLNGCAPRCGSDDVVFLHEGQVVSAVLRTRSRRYQGPPPARALGAEADTLPGRTAPRDTIRPGDERAREGYSEIRDTTAPAGVVRGIRIKTTGSRR